MNGLSNRIVIMAILTLIVYLFINRINPDKNTDKGRDTNKEPISLPNETKGMRVTGRIIDCNIKSQLNASAMLFRAFPPVSEYLYIMTIDAGHKTYDVIVGIESDMNVYNHLPYWNSSNWLNTDIDWYINYKGDGYYVYSDEFKNI